MNHPVNIQRPVQTNAEFKKLKTTIEDFTLQPEDTEQIAVYVEGLRRENTPRRGCPGT